jgi:putative two-component system response regulator
MAREITFAHHERWDGTGYPHGLRGEEIPLAARIVAIVDVYDALSSRRVYKAALPHEECVAMIRSLAGTHFDPALVEQWLLLESTFNKIARRYGNQEPADDVEWIDPEDESFAQCKEALVAAIVAGEK